MTTAEETKLGAVDASKHGGTFALRLLVLVRLHKARLESLILV
jgi:hypothetical protein